MSSWTCEGNDCSRKALLVHGDCRACAGHFCADHVYNPESHPCQAIEDEKMTFKMEVDTYKRMLKEVIEGIDMEEIMAEARRLRPGHTCAVPDKKKFNKDTKETFKHGRNINFVLTFDDGVKWMVRVRQKLYYDPSPEAVYMGFQSEAAVVQSLREGGVTVPEVYLPVGGLNHQNEKQGYFFVGFVPGTCHASFEIAHDLATSFGIETYKAIRNIAKWFISLEKVTYAKCGSPTYDSEGRLIIGPIIGPFPLLGHSPFYLGPCDTPRHRYMEYFDTLCEHILAGRYCIPQDRVGYYLQLLEAKTLVEQCEEMAEDQGPYYMLHGDPKTDIFMFDEDGEISGVLDWEQSWTTTKAMAFSAPLGFCPREFREGSNELGPLEVGLKDAYYNLGRPDLAACVEHGKKYQRLYSMFDGGYAPILKMNAIRQAFGQPSLRLDGSWPKDQTQWNKAAKLVYKDDPGLQRLIKERRARQGVIEGRVETS